jgi:Flp pilus assembly protein TadD
MVLARQFFRPFLLVALRLLALLCVFAAAAFAQDLGNIAGEVRMQDGSFPPQHYQVSLEGRGAIINSTYCDDEGRFGFYELLPNPYYVVIQADGLQPVRLLTVVNPRVAPTNVVHVVLRPIEKHLMPSLAGDSQDMVDVSELLKKYPPEVKKEYEAGRKAEERENNTEAIKRYEEVVRLAPDFYQAHNNLGGLYIQTGNLKVAEEQLRRALELKPDSAQANFNLGNVLYLTGRNAEATQVLETGLRRDPSSAMGRYFLGSVLTRLGDYSAAETQLKSAQQLDVRMPQIPLALAALYLMSKRESEALKIFEDFLRQFPNDPRVPKVRAAVAKLSKQASP